jgi:flagellar biosynthesis protein
MKSPRPPRQPDQQPDIAVALHYSGEGAPKVVAKGRGELAERILERAREHGVPLRESAELVEVLATVDIGRQIPEPLYRAVAEVIAYAWSLKGQGLDGLKRGR